MPFLQRVGRFFDHLRHNGAPATARYAVERAAEAYHERRLGISTSGKVSPEDLGAACPHCDHYYPSDYRSIYRSLARLQIRPDHDVFLDYGCGMGRVLAVAGTYPFRRVMGIEISPALSEIARENLRRAHKKLNCGGAEVITADAVDFKVPADVTVVFFYNPFRGPVLTSALAALRTSLEQAPRRVRVAFKNPFHLEPLLTSQPWLVKKDEFPACDGQHTIAILEARPPE